MSSSTVDLLDFNAQESLKSTKSGARVGFGP